VSRLPLSAAIRPAGIRGSVPRALWIAALGWWLALSAEDARPCGQPYIRTYPLDEIGTVPRSLRLGFDAHGRVAVMYDGIYAVLNDSVWVNRIDSAAPSRIRLSTIQVAGGKYYYGGRGSWGTVEQSANGRFLASPLVPANAPEWTKVNPFTKLLVASTGIYFHDFNGLVHWDAARRRNTYFPLPRVSAAFMVGERAFASCQDQSLHELRPETGTTHPIRGVALDGQVAEFAATLDGGHTLLALKDGGLVVFDGHIAVPWPPQARYRISGRVTAMERLAEGGVAIAVAAQGVYLFSADGSLRWSLLVPEFRNIGHMAAGERGVLWAAGNNAVHRIFYESPLTSFGQSHGLTAYWPRVACRDGQFVICSDGSLYVMAPPKSGHPPSFRILAGKPAGQIDYVATSGPHLLAGDATGVSAIEPDGTVKPIASIENVAGLEFIHPDVCIVIGSREIAALRYADGAWVEGSARIAGVGNAPVNVQNFKHEALWLELGGDQVARLTLDQRGLELERIPVPWHGEQWTNVGVIGDTVILSGQSGQRAYYDETRDTLGPAPHLDRLLNRSPYWLLRMKQDAEGVLWATHVHGVVTFTPHAGGYAMDSTTFDLRNDSYPTVTILPDDSIWIGASRSIYHVERAAALPHRPPRVALVSLVTDQRDVELLARNDPPSTPLRLSFDDTSLSFRFFSGTYAWMAPPGYEYRLGPAEPWSSVDPGLLLRFPKLRDATYRLEVRPAGHHADEAETFTFPFVIDPPWYRTRLAAAACSVALLLSVVGIAGWSSHRSRTRNVVLKRLVNERSRDLEIAMEKLSEETRNAATFAERSRLAAEMHDSLQQGLSGTILHLETTLTHPALAPELHAHLNVMRKMLSYCREEVQQAIWNLESPLLLNSTLGDALRKIADYIGAGSIEIKVTAPLEPAALDPTVRHHLLRIAQEALTNAVKHAEARVIRVTLQPEADAVILRVIDDGKGFGVRARLPADGHFGLRGLHSRARTIGATLQIVSQPGSGTTVQVTAPLRLTSSYDPNSKKPST
jgi:signal transduction histidine kinase